MIIQKQPQIKLYICFLFMLIAICTSCSQANQDKHIKADLTAKAKNDLNFAGVNYTVNNGMVILTGNCSSAKSKAEVEQTVKGINIIKGIDNRIVIASVVINADFPLKQAVDSVLKTYPQVQATVNKNIILLEGKAEKKDIGKLLLGLNKLHPDKIENRLKAE